MTESRFTTVERTLVEWFDQPGNGFRVEQRGRDWILDVEGREASLSECAAAIIEDLGRAERPNTSGTAS